MQDKPSPTVGLMKFSAISTRDTNSFISSREKGWDAHLASILDPVRLRFRLRFLMEVTLPQLEHQTLKPDREWFALVIVTTTLLPEDIKSALHDATRKYPWLRIVERGVDDWVGMTQAGKHALLAMEYIGNQVPFLTFRLDDDDTLPLQYLEKARGHVVPSNVDKVLTFTRGAKILWRSSEFVVCNYAEERCPLIAIGLAAIAAFDFERKDFASKLQTVFVNLNHYMIKDSLPVIEDETPHMFIWSHHVFQDTFGRYKSVEFPGEWAAVPDDIADKLAQYPSLAAFVGSRASAPT